MATKKLLKQNKQATNKEADRYNEKQQLAYHSAPPRRGVEGFRSASTVFMTVLPKKLPPRPIQREQPPL